MDFVDVNTQNVN